MGGGQFIYISLLTIFLFVFAEGVYSEDPTVFLTRDLEKKIPANEFDCRERVYIYAIFRNLKEGLHVAEAFWINPQGEQQEVSRHTFTQLDSKHLTGFTEGKDYAVWLWLELHPSTGGKLFGNIDPSAGMKEFIGKWQVRLYLDGEFITQQVFFIVC